MNRRRFLCISAAMIAAPCCAGAAVWSGTGLGAALSLRLEGTDPLRARDTFRKVEAELVRIESAASLFRDSALTRLNRNRRLAYPPEGLLELLAIAAQVHAATKGVFDPTIQPLWQAVATGAGLAEARAAIGFERVSFSPTEIRLDRGQALTLNGIAQGWAADRIARLLRADGYGHALIDMGEIVALGHRADGCRWSAAIQAPDGTLLGEAALRDRALATSAPSGTLIGRGVPHILGPQGQPPLWTTVSVSASSAVVADALSTAFCLMEGSSIEATLAGFPGARLEIIY